MYSYQGRSIISFKRRKSGDEYIVNFEDFNNRTVLIIGLVIIAILGIVFDVKDISLAVASGLVGYLSKDSNVEITHNTHGDNSNTYNNNQTEDIE